MAVVKTLVMQDQDAKPLIILMHGDPPGEPEEFCASDWREKKWSPAKPEVAQRHTGYQVGGTSPFGRAQNFCLSMSSAASLRFHRFTSTGGHRGFLVQISPESADRFCFMPNRWIAPLWSNRFCK